MNPGPSPTPERQRLLVVHRRDDIDRAIGVVIDRLHALAYPKASLFAVRLAVEEALSNAFVHGHRALPPDTPVEMTCHIGPDSLEVTVADRGPGFDPAAVPDPTLDENLTQTSGRGIVLMKAYMTSVEFNQVGNTVTLTYRRPAPKPVGPPADPAKA